MILIRKATAFYLWCKMCPSRERYSVLCTLWVGFSQSCHKIIPFSSATLLAESPNFLGTKYLTSNILGLFSIAHPTLNTSQPAFVATFQSNKANSTSLEFRMVVMWPNTCLLGKRFNGAIFIRYSPTREGTRSKAHVVS